MTLNEAFEIRKQLVVMLKSKDRKEQSTAQVLESVLRGEYLRIEDAEEDIQFLSKIQSC